VIRGRWSAGNLIALGQRAQKAVENPAPLGGNGEPILAFVVPPIARLSCDENLRLNFR
jgi:hypothetical protein